MSDDAMSNAVSKSARQSEEEETNAVDKLYECFVNGGQIDGGFDAITILKAALLYASTGEDADVAAIGLQRLEFETPEDSLRPSTITVCGILVY